MFPYTDSVNSEFCGDFCDEYHYQRLQREKDEPSRNCKRLNKE